MKYFKTPHKPTASELVNWFQIECPEEAEAMKDSDHHYLDTVPNPWHYESSVWTHTMMVLKVAEIHNASKTNLIAALLHDVGKPLAQEFKELEEHPFGKYRFIGHEGISFHLSIKILNKLEKLQVLNTEEKIHVLKLISLHGSLFDYIKDGKETSNSSKVYNMFENTFKGKQQFIELVKMVKYDHMGRFSVDMDSIDDTADKLGSNKPDGIFNDANFGTKHTKDLVHKKQHKMQHKMQQTSQIVIFTGLPCSGKSTLIEKYIESSTIDYEVISRDVILMQYANTNASLSEEITYSKIWQNLSKEDHKEIDDETRKAFIAAIKQDKNIIIDMTSMSAKSRRKWYSSLPPRYFKKSVVMCTDIDTIKERNTKRNIDTGKHIPHRAFLEMMKSFTVPTYAEFDEISFIFENETKRNN